MDVDRVELVRRHNPVLRAAHPTSVLTLGNGDLGFGVDISGLQCFPEFHGLHPDPSRSPTDGFGGLPDQPHRAFSADDYQIPLRTHATWGWYETRTRKRYSLDEAATEHSTSRGPVPYLDRMGLQRAEEPIDPEWHNGAWFHFNPRRSHLGRLALARGNDAMPLQIEELSEVHTELDLWTGQVRAEYRVDDERVTVTTLIHPEQPLIATQVESRLLDNGWDLVWSFDPQPDPLAEFEEPLSESTTWQELDARTWRATRTLESDKYSVGLRTDGNLQRFERGARASVNGTRLELLVTLTPGDRTPSVSESFADAQADTARWWEEYWRSGATVSLAGSSDPRAEELERRIVLSQFLTASHCTGSTPPAETGLVYNTWSGKFHLEMHWWHGAHFPMWNRGRHLERSLQWYKEILPTARATARTQGFKGVRWPKQTALAGRESPSHIGVFLLWQQPHLIHLLELLYNEGQGEDFLRRHYPLVEATAEFMADYAEARDGHYILPPPLIPAQESYLVDRRSNESPTFELAYWQWGLTTANRWRERVGLEKDPHWQHVADNMVQPTKLSDGTYAALATPPFLIRADHPSMLMALGWLPPTDLIEPDVMARTLDAVWQQWNMQTSWGWDYPVMAMTAARLGDVGLALEALTVNSPKNVFLPNGHNPQMPGFLSLYLPANGGLLAAIAHIVAAVADGAPVPEGWNLRWEGFSLRGLSPDGQVTHKAHEQNEGGALTN